jgi:hypothetical protein
MKRKHGASRLLFLSSLLPLFPHRTLLSACVLCVLVCLYLPLAFCDLTYLRQCSKLYIVYYQKIMVFQLKIFKKIAYVYVYGLKKKSVITQISNIRCKINVLF